MGDALLKMYLTFILLILFGMVTILTYSLQMMDILYTVGYKPITQPLPLGCIHIWKQLYSILYICFSHSSIIRINTDTNMLELVPKRDSSLYVLTAYFFSEIGH